MSTVPLQDEKIIVVYKKKDLIKQERIFLFFGFLQLEKEHKRKIAQKTIEWKKKRKPKNGIDVSTRKRERLNKKQNRKR